jgi:hypothetical protein
MDDFKFHNVAKTVFCICFGVFSIVKGFYDRSNFLLVLGIVIFLCGFLFIAQTIMVWAYWKIWSRAIVKTLDPTSKLGSIIMRALILTSRLGSIIKRLQTLKVWLCWIIWSRTIDKTLDLASRLGSIFKRRQ